MKLVLFALHGYLELFKKRGQKTLFEYAKKENFETFMEKGRWGYLLLDKTIEKSYFKFLLPDSFFPGHSFLRALKYPIPSKKNDLFFLCKFVSALENKIIETEVSLNLKEKQKLIEEIKKGNKNNEFYVYEKDIILKISKDLPLLENNFPNKIRDKNFDEIKFKNEQFEEINAIMTNSFKILNLHPINKIRIDLNEPVANFLYLYGMGKFSEKLVFSDKIGKDTFYFSDSETLEGLRIFLNIEKIDKFPNIKNRSFYWFNFALNSKETPSIWVKNFETISKNILRQLTLSEDIRFLFIFDPFMDENYEYEKLSSIFLSVNFVRKQKKKYKNPSVLFKSFLE
ncbi:MAG: hypothetical protein NC827_00900 [Candidatus Omnitrophica bacterium]|nr:hypothetical protein [Candidatus Omnitrophota bacterium]MCM8801860.1 hypothetical protein [Candidatus Omnitrophota bacterium]